MEETSTILDELINSFARMPGIGMKSARRLAYYIINSDESVAQQISETVYSAKKKLGLCRECFNLTEHEVCNICSDTSRDSSTVCVVENFSDLLLFEKLDIHNGIYHVLGGLINPLEGITPSSLKLEELFARIREKNIKEVIIGLNSSVEGDTTSLYIADKLNSMTVKVSRLASGMPVGGEIEYTDELTLRQAFRERKDIK